MKSIFAKFNVHLLNFTNGVYWLSRLLFSVYTTRSLCMCAYVLLHWLRRLAIYSTGQKKKTNLNLTEKAFFSSDRNCTPQMIGFKLILVQIQKTLLWIFSCRSILASRLRKNVIEVKKAREMSFYSTSINGHNVQSADWSTTPSHVN